MASIKPFKAIRPSDDYADVIPALPYDVYNRSEAKSFVEDNPHSFLAIDRPETAFESEFDMYSQDAYDYAKELLGKWIAEGSFTQDKQDCFYLYELTMNGRSQCGLVACASVDDYINSIIKKHENTRAEKEKDRINHVYTCKTQTGPIFLSVKKNDGLSAIFKEIKTTNPIYDVTFEDEINHKVWIVNDDEQISKIKNIFNRIDSIYIADGHHRCASAVKVAQKMREENPNFSGDEEFNYFLSVIFPADELKIYDYNRVIKDLNGMSSESFIDAIKKDFDIESSSETAIYPKVKGQVSMFIDNTWYLLNMKDSIKNDDPVEGLDVAILQKYVLDNLLGIMDPKTDNRIDFVGGIRGLNELERRVNSDCKVAFAMYPTSIDELFNVADAGLLMPPKSTWFEPKLRSGFFLHAI